jgi:hypothetical protein
LRFIAQLLLSAAAQRWSASLEFERHGLAGAGVRLNNDLLCWRSLNSFLIDLIEAIGGDRKVYGFAADPVRR